MDQWIPSPVDLVGFLFSNVSGLFRITCNFNTLLRYESVHSVCVVYSRAVPSSNDVFGITANTFAVTLFSVVEFLSLEKLYAWRGKSLSERSY